MLAIWQGFRILLRCILRGRNGTCSIFQGLLLSFLSPTRKSGFFSLLISSLGRVDHDQAARVCTILSRSVILVRTTTLTASSNSLSLRLVDLLFALSGRDTDVSGGLDCLS